MTSQPLSQGQKELVKAWHAETERQWRYLGYLDALALLGTQESASRFDLSSGETDDRH